MVLLTVNPARMSSQATLRIALPFNIQGVRFSAALMESSRRIAVPANQEVAFAHLGKYLPISFQADEPGLARLTDLVVDHASPCCRLGSLVRPLIFPRSMVVRLRKGWRSCRSWHLSFAGLLTPQRRDFFKRFLAGIGKARVPLPFRDDWPAKLWRATLGKAAQSFGWQSREMRLTVRGSGRGRTVPLKFWDEDYFELLSDSEFVLCPDGDYAWSYRFFEAVLCGAIPVVQSRCDIYNGFSFRVMEETCVAQLEYSSEIAERNFAAAEHLLTVPADLLEAELARLMVATPRGVESADSAFSSDGHALRCGETLS